MWAFREITVIETLAQGNECLVVWQFFPLTATVSIEQIEQRTGFTFINYAK